MSNNYQSRKYQVTINNPLDHGFTHEYIRDLLASLSLSYWCMADEIGSHGTPHTHIYLVSARGGIRFTTLQRKFLNVAHIEAAVGTSLDNINYIRKEGKHSGKSEASVVGSFEEWGEIAKADRDKSDTFEQLKQDILAGTSTGSIIRDNPAHIFRANRIDEARNALLSDDYSRSIRQLDIQYYFGNLDNIATHIYNTYNADSIFRWTSSGASIRFDGYTFQPILLLHGFESDIPYTTFVFSILSGFPFQLPCRFHNVQAAYSTVIITSLHPPHQLYDFSITSSRSKYKTFINKICSIYYVDNNDIQLLPHEQFIH